MSETVVVVVPDADLLASVVAARLVTTIIDAQAVRGRADVVLTGGRVAAKVLRAVKELPAAEAIDWSRVDLWWGDERFLPSGDPDRNETQAREALLDALPLVPERVHAMPPADGADGDDAAAAAARYADELAAGGATFDVLMLGVGEDGHVASLFPGHPDATAEGTVTAVHDSPKPPPTRISLTMPAIRSAAQVWLVAAGPDKADAVGAALGGDTALPAARATGATRTVWLLDAAAAAKR
ncbi:6-phosphogluconolactonase [Couchioplanes caeruleus]|uniref:6-phosphogluconolactonase n=1 Tax=Couchioplanes caeruleus subsp. caeruleus TaxID=56427 RepID=A0A1K0FRA0_9ACTN|nr:6-phosphogluconolactonase [Couchioplanes caeruleus]OJF15367.1 6-phosphogluconolactonase [Couchioplanes caeruleus subsp. caeruleus]